MGRKASTVVNGKKHCSRCKTDKEVKEFGNAKHNKSGLNSWCKTCVSDYDTEYKKSKRKEKAAKKYYQEVSKKANEFGITRVRLYWLKKTYNLSEDQYIQILISQNKCCAICKDPLNLNNQKTVHVDHCHKTNKIRGILCRDCNTGLGNFKDKAESLHAAIRYLVINQ